MKSPNVFISYSHDSAEHEARVFQLAQTLRLRGINVQLDKFIVRPPEGWSRWCEVQIRPDVSDFVLMICSGTYRDRVENRVRANEGRGVFWEGSIIYSYIYNEKENRRFIPILLSGCEEDHIPRPLRDHTRYRLTEFAFECPGYEALYRELTDQPTVTKAPLGEVVRLPLVVAPALPVREVKSNFSSPPSTEAGPHLPNGNQTAKGHLDAGLPSSPAAARGIRKFSRGVAVLAIVAVPIIWFFYGNESGKVWRKTGCRHLRDAFSEIGRQQTPALVRAKLERHLTWIRSDFTENPLTILDALDRCAFTWVNQTTSATNTLNVVIPYIAQYALLTNLSTPAEDFRSDLRLSDNSNDPIIGAMLQHAQDLKQIGIDASQRNVSTNLSASLLLPFSDIFRATAVATTNRTVPAADELFSFVEATCKFLEDADSIRVVGYSRHESQWLVLSKLQSSRSASSVLVLMHAAWTPKSAFALSEGKLTRFNPVEWRSEFEVVMPPSAWDIESAWNFLK